MASKKAKSKVIESHAVTDHTIAREAAMAVVSLIQTPLPSKEWVVLLDKTAGIVQEAIDKHDLLQPTAAKVSPQA